MFINLTCVNTNCAKRLRVPEELAGKRIRCPACGGMLDVPSLQGVFRPARPSLASAGEVRKEAGEG